MIEDDPPAPDAPRRPQDGFRVGWLCQQERLRQRGAAWARERRHVRAAEAAKTARLRGLRPAKEAADATPPGAPPKSVCVAS